MTRLAELLAFVPAADNTESLGELRLLGGFFVSARIPADDFRPYRIIGTVRTPPKVLMRHALRCSQWAARGASTALSTGLETGQIALSSGKTRKCTGCTRFAEEPLCVRVRMRACVYFPDKTGTSGTSLSISLLIH